MRRTFIEEAITSATKSEIWAQHHGAVVIYRGKIVGRGYNKYSVENVNNVNRFSVHAEVDAINNALRKISKEDLKKSTLIVVRKLKSSTNDKSKEMGLSAPCKHCANYIRKHGIKTCFYS